MRRLGLSILLLSGLLGGCVDDGRGLGDADGFEVRLHELNVAPGCYFEAGPGGPPVPEGTSDAFAQMLSATRQMSEFQASFMVQLYLRFWRAMMLDPRADRWSVEVVLDTESAPGEVLMATVTLTEQSEFAGAFDVRVDPIECPAEGCGAPRAVGSGRYDPSATRIELAGWSAVWNDDFVRLEGGGRPDPVLHRGCDPASGTSFQGYLDIDLEPLEFRWVRVCWDEAGREVTCDGVDLTPGLD